MHERAVYALEIFAPIVAEWGDSSDVGGEIGERSNWVKETAECLGLTVVKLKQHFSTVIVCLAACVFDATHGPNHAGIHVREDGSLDYRCFHDSCSEKTWAEFIDVTGWPEPPPALRTINPRGADWPSPMNEDAFIGPAGEFVRFVEPQTESSREALLFQFLGMFGSCIGRGPHTAVEADRHGANIFIVIFGKSSKARKGTSFGYPRRAMSLVDADWVSKCLASGLSSGEGLIWPVRDPITKLEPVKEKGRIVGYQEVTVDPGVDDKRLLVVESEFANVLKVSGRPGNTLSPMIRNAWDDGVLRSMTKNSPAVATGAHISIIAHITAAELRRELTATESANGFANRFIFVAAKRSRLLPEGGDISEEEMSRFAAKLRDVVDFASEARQLRRDDEARKLWAEVYPTLSEGKAGLLGAVTGRAEAQVLRLSLLYALLDESEQIQERHLRAALACWRYAEESAAYAFGNESGNRIADKILDALHSQPKGMTRTQIRDLFSRNKTREQIDEALRFLQERGLAESKKVSSKSGKSALHWFVPTAARVAA
jgi:hypothetical protein